MPNNTAEYHRHYRRELRPLYNTWAEMKQRCHNPNSQNFSRYGGRGITVCERWRDSYEAFEVDMGPRPEGATLDRIDNDGNYEPSNCRWVSMAEQALNKRTNRILTCEGRSMTVKEWAVAVGLPSSLIRKRIDRLGWSVKDALSKPSRTWNRKKVSA